MKPTKEVSNYWWVGPTLLVTDPYRLIVIPAKAGIQERIYWIPAFAGMTQKYSHMLWIRPHSTRSWRWAVFAWMAKFLRPQRR